MRLLPLLALIVLLPVQAHATTSRATTAQQLAHIESVTESIRGLKHTQRVTARFPSDSGFKTVLTNELKRDNPDNEIELSQRESVLLGFLNKNQSLRQILYGSLESQVTGLYDYHAKTLYVRSHSSKTFGVDRYVIAHEYTHALQDEHWHLGKLIPDQTKLTYRNSDVVSAHHALTEGDAVNTQYLFISRQYTPKEIQALYQEALKPSGQPLPRAIERQFYFPYDTGLAFVQRLYKLGGMPVVNAAYKRLPGSTYEIMHPSAYIRHWKPRSITLHGIMGYDDWKQMDDDVFGAFGYKTLIWQFASQKLADSATDGYRGDRYIFLENGDQNAILMKSVWSSSKAAATVRSAIASSLKARFKGSHWSGGTTLTYPSGSVYLSSNSKSVTLVFAPTTDLARGIASAQTD